MVDRQSLTLYMCCDATGNVHKCQQNSPSFEAKYVWINKAWTKQHWKMITNLSYLINNYTTNVSLPFSLKYLFLLLPLFSPLHDVQPAMACLPSHWPHTDDIGQILKISCNCQTSSKYKPIQKKNQNTQLRRIKFCRRYNIFWSFLLFKIVLVST